MLMFSSQGASARERAVMNSIARSEAQVVWCKFRRQTRFAASKRIEIASLLADPIGVVVALLPVVARCMAESPEGETVVEARFGSIAGALQMKLADQAAVVTGSRRSDA